MMRSAISPRLEMRIFLNMRCPGAFTPTNRGDAETRRPSQCIRAPATPRFRGVMGASISSRLDGEQPLAVLHGLAVLHVDLHHLSIAFGVDLVHELHRFDDAEDLPFLDLLAGVHERRRPGFGGAVE